MAAVGQVLVFRSPVDGGFSSLIFPTKRNWWRTSCPVLLDVHHCSSCPVGISLELLAPPTLMISGGTDLLSRIHKLSENVQRDGWSGCKERYASRRRSLVLQGYLSACLLSKIIEPQQLRLSADIMTRSHRTSFFSDRIRHLLTDQRRAN